MEAKRNVKKRRVGRPPGDPLAKRTVGILLRLTPIEREVLREAAEREEVPLAEWLRDLGLEHAGRKAHGRKSI